MKKLLLLYMVVLVASPAGAVLDGLNIRNKYCPSGLPGCSVLKQVQANHTGFGDTRPATGGFVAGSELDQLWVYKTADALGINITGNLETNGNAWVVFLDVITGGQNTLSVSNGPGSVTGQSGNKFDAGFEPDYALAINTYGGTVYVNLVNIQNNTDTYLGNIPVGSSGPLTGGSNPNGTALAFNNTNNAGVTGNATRTAAETQLDAETAQKGLEMLLSLADIGLTSASLTQVKVMVDLGNGGYLSNQVLPGIGSSGQKGDLGKPTGGTDFSNEAVAPGLQYATVDVSTEKTSNGSMDGDDIPTDSPAGSLAATQNNYTNWGDASGTGTQATYGSELDAFFMSNTAATLDLAITGNLENNGNYWVIFLETGTGGVDDAGIDTPPGAGPPSGIMLGLNGTLFDEGTGGFHPTHAVLISTGDDSGTKYAYINIYDFRSNSDHYLGRVAVNSGLSALLGGSNPNGSMAAFNDTNVDGVTDNAAKVPADNETDAKTADSGLELSLALNDLGVGQLQIKYLVALTGNHGYFSNQLLPSLGGGFGNLGDKPNFSSAVIGGVPGIAGLQYAVYTLTGVATTSFSSVADLKAQPDSGPISITGRVSAIIPDSLDSNKDEFYVQTGFSGILIRGSSSTPGLAEGKSVKVTGAIGQAHGERAVYSTDIDVLEDPPVQVTPTFILGGSLGGGQLGNNPGIASGIGLNNIGLLVKIGGTVTGTGFADDGNYFYYVDDGSNLNDGNTLNAGSAYLGVRVETTVYTLFPTGLPGVADWVSVEGVSSVSQLTGSSQRRIHAISIAKP